MEKEGLHFAIVCDGNRRWAEKNDKPRIEGHEFGFKALKDEVLPALFDAKVPYVDEVSLFGFSTENWERQPAEVKALMNFARSNVATFVPDALKRGVRIHHAGRKNKLAPGLLRSFRKAEKDTAHGQRGQLNICFDYGGRDEIARAATQAVKKKSLLRRILNQTTLTPEEIRANLDIPRPVDIFFRPGGEQRLSGYLQDQVEYAELIFRDELLPEVTRITIQEVLHEFQQRERRNGS